MGDAVTEARARDRDLVERARAGDRAAFDVLAEREGEFAIVLTEAQRTAGYLRVTARE